MIERSDSDKSGYWIIKCSVQSSGYSISEIYNYQFMNCIKSFSDVFSDASEKTSGKPNKKKIQGFKPCCATNEIRIYKGICGTPPVFKALPNPLRSKAVFPSYLMHGSAEASPAMKRCATNCDSYINIMRYYVVASHNLRKN